MAEYREGHFAGAVEWTEKVLAASRVNSREVEACMVMAMAHYHLRQIDKAQATFAKGLIESQAALPSNQSKEK